MGSTAFYGLISGSATSATVLGSSSHAVWILVDDRVLALTTGDATRLPNGVQLAATSQEDFLSRVEHGEPAQVGGNRVMFKELSIDVNRWWDPRPVLAKTTREHLAAAVADLPNEVPEIDSTPLRVALEARSSGGILHASRSLLGKGPGLTPEGDDFLAGAMAATRLLAEALGYERAVGMIAGISMPLAALAGERTTTFSAALIECALRGQVAEPAGALLRAITGRGDVPASHLGLIRVGHTSGPALAAGIVLGAQSLLAS